MKARSDGKVSWYRPSLRAGLSPSAVRRVRPEVSSSSSWRKGFTVQCSARVLPSPACFFGFSYYLFSHSFKVSFSGCAAASWSIFLFLSSFLRSQIALVFARNCGWVANRRQRHCCLQRYDSPQVESFVCPLSKSTPATNSSQSTVAYLQQRQNCRVPGGRCSRNPSRRRYGTDESQVASHKSMTLVDQTLCPYNSTTAAEWKGLESW